MDTKAIMKEGWEEEKRRLIAAEWNSLEFFEFVEAVILKYNEAAKNLGYKPEDSITPGLVLVAIDLVELSNRNTENIAYSVGQVYYMLFKWASGPYEVAIIHGAASLINS